MGQHFLLYLSLFVASLIHRNVFAFSVKESASLHHYIHLNPGHSEGKVDLGVRGSIRLDAEINSTALSTSEIDKLAASIHYEPQASNDYSVKCSDVGQARYYVYLKQDGHVFGTHSVPLSDLLDKCNESETLEIKLDQAGHVAGFSYSLYGAAGNGCAEKVTACSGVVNVDKRRFQAPHLGLILMNKPPELPYVVMRKAAAESKENAVDDRGFFAKYWMYVLPLVAILLMNAGGSSNSS